MADYNVTINSIDRTGDVIARSVVVEDAVNDQQNTCKFDLIDLSGSGIPVTDQEIRITLADATVLFGGYVVGIELSKSDTGAVMATIDCVDYARLLDRNLAKDVYENMTDKAIIEKIVNDYCIGFGITTVNVIEGVTISQIAFNYIQISQALRQICDLTSRNWYIDYNKDIHYFPLTTNTAPFNIDSTNNEYSQLKITKDASQLKNRVYVRGGTYLSDFTTYTEKGDGSKRKFSLPDRPHNVTMTINGGAKSIGIKNVNTSGYDWYLNYQEKYLEQDSGGTVLSTTDVLSLQYKYDVPILVAVEDHTSILANGQNEFAIFDKSIATVAAARDRATAELTDYATSLIEGSFITHTPGFISGQYININLTEYGINENYLVQKVVAKSLGGGIFYYEVSIASAKTMGIIRFLIELLEANKNLLVLDPDEVIDELFEQADAILIDSLTEALTIDSAGAYSTWCTDSAQSSPITRARWDLFQWM